MLAQICPQAEPRSCRVNCWAWENLMICQRTESNDILLELVAKTLAVGATEMQVEYEDREEHVLAFQDVKTPSRGTR